MPEKGKDTEKHDRNSPGITGGARIISYNLNEDQRPGEMKIRFKVRVEKGRKAAVLDARQAEAIREYLQWVRQHRNTGHGEPPPGTPAPAR